MVIFVDAKLKTLSILLCLDCSHVYVEFLAELLKDSLFLAVFFYGILEHYQAGLFEKRLAEDVLLSSYALTDLLEILQTLIQHCS